MVTVVMMMMMLRRKPREDGVVSTLEEQAARVKEYEQTRCQKGKSSTKP